MAAARPRLASAIFDEFNNRNHHPAKRQKVGTGCAALDGALDGGFHYGSRGLSCISGDTGTGKTLVSHSIIF